MLLPVSLGGGAVDLVTFNQASASQISPDLWAFSAIGPWRVRSLSAGKPRAHVSDTGP
jgi:hypothetical protein